MTNRIHDCNIDIKVTLSESLTCPRVSFSVPYQVLYRTRVPYSRSLSHEPIPSLPNPDVAQQPRFTEAMKHQASLPEKSPNPSRVPPLWKLEWQRICHTFISPWVGFKAYSTIPVPSTYLSPHIYRGSIRLSIYTSSASAHYTPTTVTRPQFSNEYPTTLYSLNPL